MKEIQLIKGDNMWCSKGCHLCDDSGIVRIVENDIIINVEDDIYDRIYPIIMNERQRKDILLEKSFKNTELLENIPNYTNELINIYFSQQKELIDKQYSEIEELKSSITELRKELNEVIIWKQKISSLYKESINTVV